MVKKYIGLPIFKKNPIGRYGPQKISSNHCLRMLWATYVKKQNLGLADTCLPSGKKWYQLDPRANWIKEGARGTTEEAHQERFFFFSGWLSMAFFYLPLHHTTCIFSLPACGGPAAHLLGGPTYRNNTRFFIKPPKNAILCLFWGRKHYGRGWAWEGERQSKNIKKSWCAVAILTKQVQFFSGRRCVVDTHASPIPQ